MLARLDAQIVQIEQRLLAWMKQDQASQTIAQIPGVGLLTATAAVATMGNAKAINLFSSVEFCGFS
jgi:transposase